MSDIRPSDYVTNIEYQAARVRANIDDINGLIMDDENPFHRIVIPYLTIAVANLEIALILVNKRLVRKRV